MPHIYELTVLLCTLQSTALESVCSRDTVGNY
jgi:hypothetical protein